MPIRNAPSTLPTTLRFMGSRLVRHLDGRAGTAGAPDFRARIERVLKTLGDAVLRCDWIEQAPSGAAWIETGVSVAPGQALSLLADGMIYASRAFDVGFGPGVGLWYRIGESEVSKIVGQASTVYSPGGGALRLALKPPGEFADRGGDFLPQPARDRMGGGFRVAIVQWRGDPAPALAAGASLDPEFFGAALARLQSPVDPPAGWNYLWRLGQGEIFSPAADAPAELCCHTRADVGILQFPVDRAFTQESRVSWSWCVEQLPSRLPEHIEPTHDYLSLAVEFDNGLDLTWMWSAALPVDTIFQCPLAWWKERETHWVVRSGTAQLGQWLDERRSLADDYAKAIGGALPRRIVGVWLIANSVFQRGEGRCRYRHIAIEDAAGVLPIRA